MSDQDWIGWLLVSGLVAFTVGAARWRRQYEQPLEIALPLKASDKRRLRWIHLWMMVGIALTTVGLAATAIFIGSPWSAVAAVLYAMGATAFLISITFRLTVEDWAAVETMTTGEVPSVYLPLSAWSGGLYGLHMVTAYLSALPLAVVILVDDIGPVWLGWGGVVWGTACAVGFVLTRGSGFFSPPILAHVFTAALGLALVFG